MAAALELTPTLGAGAASRAMGLGRGEPARQKARAHHRTVMGPPRPRAPRPCPPLALDANERQTVLDTLNSERFADSLARLSGDEQKLVKTMAFDLQLNLAAPGLSFHKLDQAKDKNCWSLRASIDPRPVVHRTVST